MRVVRLKPYIRAMKAMGFGEAGMQAAESLILRAPDANPLIAGLQGARKARVARPGKGKRGEGRVVYYFTTKGGLIAFLLAYSKNQKDDLTNDDRRALLRAIDLL